MEMKMTMRFNFIPFDWELSDELLASMKAKQHVDLFDLEGRKGIAFL